jgi:RNA polymerase sigma factor (sigma-70 family)
MTVKAMPLATNSDAELVGESVAGNRDAFGQIVARYQSLICSLAYSATGSLSQSEDLAQDTFVTAWKQLAGLREPTKLRSWLCGIARNLILNARRRQGHEPSHHAEPLEEIKEVPAVEPLPVEQTISREEEGILWRSLEGIPEIYREPLILFYREHQSAARVAEALELSEEAVHQRLSRGRKLLHEQVLAFVEGALEKTAPGKAFTMSVMAVLPLLVVTTESATAGAAVTKGGTAIKMFFMTKTTQAIVVAAATATAILTTQTVWHHYRNSDTPRAGRSAQTPLTPQQAAEAKQAARGFLEAVRDQDWSTVAKYWPPGAPKKVDDVFTAQNKELVDGMEIISLGQPYKERQNPSLTDVPYEVRWKSGGTQTNSLRLMQGRDGHWIWIGGF